MNAPSQSLRLFMALVGIAAGAFSAVPTQAATIGAGVGIPLDDVDTAGSGPRTNVDESFAQLLPAGVYVVRDWSYAAGQSGSVIPFAATSNGVDSYQVAALGQQVDLVGAATATTNFGYSNTFVITAPTTVYAAITNPGASQNPIFLDNGTATTTDHDGSPTAVTAIGQTVDGFSNPNLGRTYAFSLNVDTRPVLRAGADVGIPRETLDTADGPRMNIDDSFTITLPAGNYLAKDFSYAAGRVGDVTPFLAALNGSDYQIVAVGSTVTTGAGDTIQTVDFGGSSFFTLAATTTLYAGITNPGTSSNPIYLDNETATTTDHDGSPAALTGVGQLIALGSISNQDLGRSYAFSIGIVPEPTSATLCLLGFAGLLLARRRRTA